MDIKELNLEEFFVFMHAFKKRDLRERCKVL